MKTITTREFFHAPGLLKSLHPGESVAVTDKGTAAFTVTKAGRRPRKTRADLQREAAEISVRKAPKINFTAAIKQLKSR